MDLQQASRLALVEVRLLQRLDDGLPLDVVRGWPRVGGTVAPGSISFSNICMRTSGVSPVT